MKDLSIFDKRFPDRDWGGLQIIVQDLRQRTKKLLTFVHKVSKEIPCDYEIAIEATQLLAEMEDSK